ncbi:MAG: tRNA (guanosine(18)-2'-O)-methyltransferase TrmH [Calditrichaeota bacterium]|nr:MAG: tRNA (guanosine(18)-2'-O)-methyltransferase TrmH [Calditrichota bacterium]MBL1206810.1 tRNA (guanosine(18)-2'-O)-methyltransferase TrmH [Calditrichota bacterium]NOG46638.1 tRNA (guanosine(18)-2'-O)-methyltransferase TrmH [Calditrichota bacterium]
MTPSRYKKILQMLKHRQPSLTVVMENVHKAHNLAAIARTSDAAGIPEIHAITRFDELNLTQDAASGSGRWVNVKTHTEIGDAYKHLKKKGFQLLTAHFNEQAKDFREIDFCLPTAIVVGQELDGLTDEAIESADGSIIIPMYGMVQSLNVSVATAIILYEAQRQRHDAGMYEKSNPDEKFTNDFIFEKGYPRLAAKLREKGEPFPKLDDEGAILG